LVKISNPQIKIIYAKAKELGLDNELLHQLVFNITGQEHISALSKFKAIDVIDDLEYKITGVKKEKVFRENMASQDQIYKIKALESELGWIDNPKRLKAFMKKYTGTENLNWLTFYKASNLIESLKKVLKREENKSTNSQ